jgi:hypothetical protein
VHPPRGRTGSPLPVLWGKEGRGLPRQGGRFRASLRAPVSAPSIEFVLHVHRSEALLEVVYPAAPTPESFARYEQQVRAAVAQLPRPWDCLVDLRAVRLVTPELGARGLALTRWARGEGLRRMSRVITQSALAALQARRVLREGGLEDTFVFHTPDEARTALREAARSPVRG